MDLHSFVQIMPKVELHVHFEGAILPATLLELAARNHVNLGVQDEDGMRELYRFRNFAHFLEIYHLVTGCLRSVEDYARAAYEFGRERSRQHIRYSEVTFTILSNMEISGLSWQAIMDGVNRGRRQAWLDFGVDWRWILDIVRNDPDTQDQVTDIVLAAWDRDAQPGGPGTGVIALGLGGSEAGYPAELFTRSFERASLAGLPCIPHSGENAGPANIWASIQKLHARRLGHGVRCIEDSNLVEYLRRQRLPLEVCPTSNVCLGVYPDYSALPLRKLWDAGVTLTINSDDPPMFDTDLNHEFEILIDQFGFTANELEQIDLNALQASLLGKEEKADLETEFLNQFSIIRKDLVQNPDIHLSRKV
jgi:aminodeoxyfutalosine deaminase